MYNDVIVTFIPPETTTTPFGAKIRKLRKEQGMTLEQLGNRAGCTKAYVRGLEIGDYRKPSVFFMDGIAKALGVTIDYLIDETGNISEDDAVDAAFIQEYRSLPQDIRHLIRDVVKTCDNWMEAYTDAA